MFCIFFVRSTNFYMVLKENYIDKYIKNDLKFSVFSLLKEVFEFELCLLDQSIFRYILIYIHLLHALHTYL